MNAGDTNVTLTLEDIAMYIILMQFAFAIIAALVLVTQIVVPLIGGTRVFPMFNKRKNKLHDELASIKTDTHIETMERDMISQRKNLDRIKKENSKTLNK